MVEFLDYIRDSGLLDQKQLISLRDSSTIQYLTTYQYLYTEGSSDAYNIDYSKLRELITEYLATQDINLVEVTESRDLECDPSVYRSYGGITEKNAARIIPLVQISTGNKIILMMKPDDVVERERVKQIYAGDPFSFAVCSPSLWSSLTKLFVDPLLVGSLAAQMSLNESNAQFSKTVDNSSEARKLYRKLIKAGIDLNASDIHFIPCSDTCKVMLRIDGHNSHYTDIPLSIVDKIGNILRNDSQVAVKDPRMAVDGKVRFSVTGREEDEIDLRISIMPTKKGQDINVRYLSSKLFTFEELGMTDKIIKQFRRLLALPTGMVIQVGPTGSGKSTTLYSGLKSVMSTKKNIITIEDPVEIQLEGITQVDVDGEEGAKFGFEEALKACLRHDPDIIVVGELRNNNTAALSVRGANTGHLVITTLHTNDSIGAVDRMLNMGIDPYSLGEVLAAIMSQRLVRRLCPHCKEPYELDLKSDRARFFRLPNEEGTMTFYKACGCVRCNNTGYKGRIAINEILMIDREIRSYVQRHAIRSVYEDYLHKNRFVSMYEDGLEKAKAGITSLEEMEEYAADTLSFKG